MRLTSEQELHVRQTLATRIKALSRRHAPMRPDAYTDGWNDATAEILMEIMGGAPLYTREWSDVPAQLSQFGKRRNGTSAPVEDVQSIDAYQG